MRPLASSVSTVLLYRPAFSRLSRSRPRSTAYSPAKVGLSSSSWTGTGTRNATQTARPRQTTWRRTQVWWRAGGTRSVSDVAMGAARGAGAGRHEERARRSPGGVLRSRRCQQASIARGSTLGLFGDADPKFCAVRWSGHCGDPRTARLATGICYWHLKRPGSTHRTFFLRGPGESTAGTQGGVSTLTNPKYPDVSFESRSRPARGSSQPCKGGRRKTSRGPQRQRG